jgi:hypothetical protein
MKPVKDFFKREWFLLVVLTVITLLYFLFELI